MAGLPLPRGDDLDKLVEQKIVITRSLDVLDDRQERSPLLFASQAALTENNQARVYVHVEKFDEVAAIGRYDAEIMVEGISPNLMVGPPG